MINLFGVNLSDDMSVYYLGQIFGNVGFALQGTGPALLGNMFKTFNTALLIIGVIVVAWTTIAGTLITAHEGKFLGSKWHTLWVPIRTVFGIATLMPTGSGYCAIQVIFMWFILQGVGAADLVWNTAVDYFAQGGSLQPSAPTSITDKTPDQVRNLFSGLVCQSMATKIIKNSAGATATNTITPGAGVNFDVPGEDPAVCGKLAFNYGAGIVKNPQDVPAISSAQYTAFQEIISTLGAIANLYVNSIVKTSDCWLPCSAEEIKLHQCAYFDRYKSPQFDNANCPAHIEDDKAAFEAFSQTTGSNFVTDISRLIGGSAANYAVNYQMAHPKPVPDYLKNAKKNGWIFAGSFYYAIGKNTGDTQANYNEYLNSFASVPPPSDRSKFKNQNAGSLATIADIAAQRIASGAIAETSKTGFGGDLGPAAGPTSTLGGASASVLNDFKGKIAPQGSDTTNPLVKLQDFGHDLLNGAAGLFFTSLVTGMVVGAFSKPFEVIFGQSINIGVAGVLDATLKYLVPASFFLMGVLITIGSLFAVYMPLIPYMLFTFGAIGWMVVAIEAMIAAPIVAIGILSPGGQHEIMGRGDASLMILLNVFLRPTLMVFGLMSGMLLSYIVVKFINAAFFNVFASIASQGSIIEGIIFIFAYAGIVITALNKCFSLIHHVPDKVLRWIGVSGEGAGEEQMAQAVKGQVSSGTEGASGMAKGAGTGAGQIAAQARKNIKARGKQTGDSDVGTKPSNEA